jgi:hypothetical protein
MGLPRIMIKGRRVISAKDVLLGEVVAVVLHHQASSRNPFFEADLTSD